MEVQSKTSYCLEINNYQAKMQTGSLTLLIDGTLTRFRFEITNYYKNRIFAIGQIGKIEQIIKPGDAKFGHLVRIRLKHSKTGFLSILYLLVTNF